MNTAEKVARLEEVLQRVQANARLPRPDRRAARASAEAPALAAPATDVMKIGEELEAQRIAAEQASKEAAERAAREAAEIAATAKAQAEQAAKEAVERVAREAAAAKEAAEKAAKEAAAKEAAERAAREAAMKEAAEKAAREKAEREAAERAAKEKAEKEAAERAAKEKAEKEAAEKAARAKAEREAAEKAAKEKAAADKAAAERAAKEKAAAEKAAADKAAREKAAKEAADKAEKAAAEKAAKEKAAKEAADKAAAEKAAKEKAAKEAADKAAKETTDRAAKQAATASAAKAPATIDELFAELELSSDATKVGPRDQTPSPTPVRAAPPKAPPAPPAAVIKDEPTLDTGEVPTVIADRSQLDLVAGELPTREAPVLPMDSPTRVAEPIASMLDAPTLDAPTVEGPTIVQAAAERSPEPEEATVIRRPSDKDRAMLRGEVEPEEPGQDEEPTLLRPEEPKPKEPAADVIKAVPVISVGGPSTDDKPASAKPPASHEPKVELAEPLREAAEKAAREAAEKAAQEAALRAKTEKSKEREEITTASRRIVQLTPELIEQERKAREREDAERNKKKGVGATVGLTLATAALVAGGLYLALTKGWFDSTPPPGPAPTASTAVIAPTAGTPTSPTTTAPATAQTTAGTPTPSASAAEPTAPASPQGVSADVSAKANARPFIVFLEKSPDAAKLAPTKAYLTVLSNEDVSVFFKGAKAGVTNQRLEVPCPVGNVRLGIAHPSTPPEWRSAAEVSILVKCREHTVVSIPASKPPWAPPPGKRPAGGGGGGTDPY